MARSLAALRAWLTHRIALFLTTPVGDYELCGPNDFERLKRLIRPGDVLLVQGDQRVSAVIKYLTQSSWSHAALYIGDEMLRRGGDGAEAVLASHGEGARHLIVEALFDGVVAEPIDKYVDYNVRLVRPHRLRSKDLKVILDQAVSALGWQYDLRNIIDLAAHLVLSSLLPGRYRGRALQFGSGAATEVICTSLLGRIFHEVGFPVLPSVTRPAEPPPRPRGLRGLFNRSADPHAGLFRHRHPTLLTPRDFDLSPYFEIVKFNVIEAGSFDYHRIAWADEEPEGED